MTGHSALPYVDEHAITVAAEPSTVRIALLATLDRTFSRPSAAAYARAVGCSPHQACGPRPLAAGSTVPGFAVSAAGDDEVILEGRHHFSTYALVFRLDPASPGRTCLRAETRASFPGLRGGVYRALVIGTRGHVVGTRRLLGSVRRRAEAGLD